ncbi:MAG: pimeloyl-ACP methyl esterase BioG family protein [Desulfopila sp.]
MIVHWQYRANRRKLLIFCNGWGMDELPFTALASDAYDVVLLGDFRQMPPAAQILAEVASYAELTLVAWSMGVWAGQRLFAGEGNRFARTIAINGTLCPVSDRFGIPGELFVGTLSGWSELARKKFYHRLTADRDTEKEFLVRQPRRTLIDQ